ncbi:hypothetical protein XPA_006219 [Xanthoria parietina]
MLTNVGGDLLSFEKLPSGALTNQTRADHDAAFGRDWPDVEILTLDGYTGRLNDFLTGAPDLGNYASIIIGTIAPFSRGNVSISSGDTNVYPNVNPNWISDPRDREIAVAAFKRARAIFQNGAVQPLLVGPEAYPGDTVETDERILQYITSSSSTIHHAAGTNRKGKSDDPMAVVDSRGLIGVQGLRMVDISASTLLPPGQPQATVYALAEKIAEDILKG